MLRRKVRGYDSFRCIAGDCPQTCCAGWLIEIDDEALEGYQKETSAYGGDLARTDRLGGKSIQTGCGRTLCLLAPGRSV